MDDPDDMDVSLDGTHTKRACDSCRTRKIRCDRNIPCSNCKASKLTCTTSAPVQKAQRQRVHISEEYHHWWYCAGVAGDNYPSGYSALAKLIPRSEKKIDRIEDRLAGIENVLESLASKLSSLDIRRDSAETSSQSRSSRLGTGRSPGAMGEAATPAPFEGETAINSQSGFARELLAQAVGSTPSIGQNAEIKSALTALEELVTQQGQSSSTSNPLISRSLADIDPEKLDRPPWDVAMDLLDKATKYPTMSFAVVFPFLKMKNLKVILEDVYQNAGSCGAARRILGFGVLENLFTELKVFPLIGMDVANFSAYSVLCRRQLEVAISQLDLMMPASYENIMALLLGAAQAVEWCKPSLCWIMISSAAGLCQNLGYHRVNTMVNDPPEIRQSKIHTFWMIFMFDKTLSLRLGRASVIQDWDISLPFILHDSAASEAPQGSRMLSYWVKVARVQGQTYQKLFSPAAFLKSSEERTRVAVELVNAMNVAWFERDDANVSDMVGLGDHRRALSSHQAVLSSSPGETERPSKRKPVAMPDGMRFDPSQYIHGSFEQVQDIFFHADVVMHYSTCALIQRAVTQNNVAFNQECLESSRAALMAHMRANSQFNKIGNEEMWSGYVHWSVLQAPFTPFIVIFCNAIQKTDPSDLASLSNFVTSLESCRTISEGADRLYKMCRLFLRVAKLYIQAKTQDASAQLAPESTQPNYYTTVDGTQLDLNAMTQFDPYLSALGLMSTSAWIPGLSNAPAPAGVDAFAQGPELGNLYGPDTTGMGFGPSGGNQQSVQDFFSGSRYLMNLMEAGDDMQMPDLDF